MDISDWFMAGVHLAAGVAGFFGTLALIAGALWAIVVGGFLLCVYIDDHIHDWKIKKQVRAEDEDLGRGDQGMQPGRVQP